MANQLPDAFTDTKMVTKSHIPATNAPIRIDIPGGHSNMTNESQTRLKRGRPVGSKDKNPQMRKREKKERWPNRGGKSPKRFF